MYSPALWQLLEDAAASASPPTAAHSHPAAAAATASKRHPHQLLHVAALYRPSHGPDSDSYYTLAVTHPRAPRAAADRFALSLSRSLARGVLYSARILREEPALVCEFDAPFRAGLQSLRSACAQPPRPAVSIFTRARRDDVLHFAHPLFSAHPHQRIEVLYGREAYGERLRRALGSDVREEPTVGDGAFSASLAALRRFSASMVTRGAYHFATLILPSSSPHLSGAHSSIHFPSMRACKRIFFRPLQRPCLREVCDAVRDGYASLEHSSNSGSLAGASEADRHSFLRHLSIEAGPNSTASLYADPSRPPPVRTLLLSVFRDSALSSDYASALSRADEPSLDTTEGRALLVLPPECTRPGRGPPPPPSITRHQIERWYDLRSEHRSEEDPRWSFLWYQIKPQFDCN